MRIAMTVEAFPVLSQTFVLQQITGLLDLGHDVRIVSLNQPEDEVVHPDIDTYDLLSRTQYIETAGRAAPAADALRAGARRLSKLCGGFARDLLTRVPAIRRIARGPYPPSADLTERIRGAIADRDIVHCHFGPAGVAALPATRAEGTPLLVTFHGFDLRACVESNGKPYADLFAQSEGVMAVSRYSGQKLVDCGLPPEKMLVHPVGVDTRMFSPNRSHDGGDGPCRIITVARLVEDKDLALALRVVRRLRDEAPHLDFRYDIIGDGPLEARLTAVQRKLGLEDVVTFLGPRDSDGVKKHLAESDIFLLTSRNEVTPVVLMEAQASGLPVVTTDVGAIREVVEDGASGFVVADRSADALAERLRHLIENPQVWPEMGRAGRRLVEEKFDVRRLNERLVRIYENVLAGRPPGETP